MITFTLKNFKDKKGSLTGRVLSIPGEPVAEYFLNLMGNAVWECRPHDCSVYGVTLQENELLFYHHFKKYFPVLEDVQHEILKPSFPRTTTKVKMTQSVKSRALRVALRSRKEKAA